MNVLNNVECTLYNCENLGVIIVVRLKKEVRLLKRVYGKKLFVLTQLRIRAKFLRN